MNAQVDKIMLARKKAGALMPKWAAIKGKHKVVANRGIFKADVETPIKKYDDAVQSYSDENENKKKLVEVLKGIFKKIEKVQSDQDKLKADRDKSDTDMENNKNWDQAQAFQNKPDADSTEVLKTLTDLASSVEKTLNYHKQVMDKIIAAGFTMIDVFKGGRDEYKEKSGKVETALQKAYDDATSAQAAIRDALSKHISTAQEIENAPLTQQLQNLYKLANT